MGSHTHEVTDAIIDTLKRAGSVLKSEGVRFALAGGCAAYARGAAPSLHDVDFVLVEEDVPRALEVLRKEGFRTAKPPEDWLVKAFDEQDTLVDLIFRIEERAITPEMIARAQMINTGALSVPVMDATDLVISWILPMSEHSCDYGSILPQVRALREQVNWDQVAVAASVSPYASTFLTLLDRLGVACPKPPADNADTTWP
ncbi:nucleotidyltransferase [Sphaerisporangium sp. TRM90804]|uniref:nucleotidyltransferase n=1 Tax=Sphaerisporangium sp. TRM90804 TaxID=3031113 RepID=UPI0024498EA1|nr:nucleotidyltransferase [Sphaerisporangium sp. TRM90804]MDH2427505.1 nucleotidyltransferase [Sphaerisporangium sp. TRM90804]